MEPGLRFCGASLLQRSPGAMMKSRSRLVLVLALLACACSSGNDGPAGPNGVPGGPTGPAGPDGPKGSNGAAVGILNGTVTASATGKLLGGVAITAAPGELSATTANDGTFSWHDLLPGSYAVTFHRTGYADKTLSIGITTGDPTNVAVALDTDAKSGGPSIVV